nr:hypothetical protein [Tanacetum cinerariifolium]
MNLVLSSSYIWNPLEAVGFNDSLGGISLVKLKNGSGDTTLRIQMLYGARWLLKSYMGTMVVSFSSAPNSSGVRRAVLEVSRLMDAFPRLFALEKHKDCTLKDRWTYDNGGWEGSCSWRVSPRGHALDDISSFISIK